MGLHDTESVFLLSSAEDTEIRTMKQEASDLSPELAQFQQQFVEFRSTQPVRSRLPEPLWAEAAQLAARYGVHQTARVLHLDYVGLKKRVESQRSPKPKRTASSSGSAFVELVRPATTITSCRIEVEATPGKLRLELPAMDAAELTQLIRAFLGH